VLHIVRKIGINIHTTTQAENAKKASDLVALKSFKAFAEAKFAALEVRVNKSARNNRHLSLY
jgi:hypothetical protein